MTTGGLFLGIESAIELIPHVRKLQSDTLRLRDMSTCTVLDEKSIPASKIQVSWAMGDSIPYLVPTRSYLFPAQPPWPLLKRDLSAGILIQS